MLRWQISSYFNEIILQWSTDGHNCSLQRFCRSGGPLPCSNSCTVVTMSWCCSLLSYCWNDVEVVWLSSHVASSSRSNIPVCRYRTAGLDLVGQLDHYQIVSIGLIQCYYSPPCDLMQTLWVSVSDRRTSSGVQEPLQNQSVHQHDIKLQLTESNCLTLSRLQIVKLFGPMMF